MISNTARTSTRYLAGRLRGVNVASRGRERQGQDTSAQSVSTTFDERLPLMTVGVPREQPYFSVIRSVVLLSMAPFVRALVCAFGSIISEQELPGTVSKSRCCTMHSTQAMPVRILRDFSCLLLSWFALRP